MNSDRQLRRHGNIRYLIASHLILESFEEVQVPGTLVRNICSPKYSNPLLLQWMYIVPVVVLMMLTSQQPEQQGEGGSQ